MALGEGLGRLFDVESNISRNTGNTKCVSLKDYGGVTFVCWVPAGGQDLFIVKSASAAVANSGSFTAFNPISRYYNKALDDGTTQWTDSGDLTANLGTITVLSGQVAFYVGADDLPAGNSYVQVVPGTSGIVTAILQDPIVQRNPKYLRAPNS
jgi:hypothetical protein